MARTFKIEIDLDALHRNYTGPNVDSTLVASLLRNYADAISALGLVPDQPIPLRKGDRVYGGAVVEVTADVEPDSEGVAFPAEV